MYRFLGLLLVPLLFLDASLPAQTTNADTNAAPVAPQTELGRLVQSNRELLDLLKKQQAVLEDIQYDRRLQNRQIQMLEERLTDALQANVQMAADVEKLKTELADKTTALASAPVTPASASTTNRAAATPTPDNPPPGPVSYLPPPEAPGAAGSKNWNRLLTLSGTDSKTTDILHIDGQKWRVVWHNQDKPGTSFQNTSALFINAFPKDDQIPEKVCAKLGSGGDKTVLDGPGNYYLKIEASGGSWELAIEDYH